MERVAESMDKRDKVSEKRESGHRLNRVLKRLMTECEIDDSGLAKATQVPLTTIARMRASPTANPTASSLRPLSRYFNISISQLLGDEPLPLDRPVPDDVGVATVKVPLISWKQAVEWTRTKALFKCEIKNWIISGDLQLTPMSYALEIENNAYGDLFRPGTILIIDPGVPPVSNAIVVMQLGQDYEDALVLKEILLDGDSIYLKSINPELARTLPLEQPYQYCGVVMQSIYVHHRHNPARVEVAARRLLTVDKVSQTMETV